MDLYRISQDFGLIWIWLSFTVILLGLDSIFALILTPFDSILTRF